MGEEKERSGSEDLRAEGAEEIVPDLSDPAVCKEVLEKMAVELKVGGERGPTRNISRAISYIEDAADKLDRALREDV